MDCTNSSNVSGPDVVGASKMHGDEYIKMGNGFAHSGTCKKELESTIRKIVKEERSQW